MADDKPPIIIKKINKIEGGHHGGAWKVAYADFVTAMMAFFLLLWLLNVTTKEQLSGIADYFKVTAVSTSISGSGGVMGGLSLSKEGQLTSDLTPIGTDFTMEGKDNIDRNMDASNSENPEAKDEVVEEAESLEAASITEIEAEEERFKEAIEKLYETIQSDPLLQGLAENLIVDMTDEGLRIQLIDQTGRSMFPLGKAVMYDDTYLLISKVTQVIEAMPNKISIRGHTDGVPYGDDAKYNNWDLSADRANASRRAMVQAGLNKARVENVIGKADTEHLVPSDPKSPQNRRISIILLREHKLQL